MYQHKHLYVHLFTTILLIIITSLFSVSAKVPAVIVFGDSSVDTGNNNALSTLLRSDFAPYGRDFVGSLPTGRFCNGRLPSDFISEAYGLKKTVPAYLDPSYGISDFATGVVFASAGTGYDNSTAAVLNVMPLWKEVELYKEYQQRLRAYAGEARADEIIKDSAYIVSIGTNDFLENYYLLPTTRMQYTIQEFEDRLVEEARGFVKTMYSLGARKISLSGILPMGCLPLERTTNFMAIEECNEEYNNVALEFNGKMKNLVNQLNRDRELHGVRVVFSNPYYILKRVMRKPHLFGMEVTNEACCGTGLFEMSYLCNIDSSLSCPDADKYMFWDAFHPTEKTNSIASQHLFQTVLYKLL